MENGEWRMENGKFERSIVMSLFLIPNSQLSIINYQLSILHSDRLD
jgi:hypothetical protein